MAESPKKKETSRGRGDSDTTFLEILADMPEIQQAVAAQGQQQQQPQPNLGQSQQPAPGQAGGVHPQVIQAMASHPEVHQILEQILQEGGASQAPQAPQAPAPPDLSLGNRFAMAARPSLSGIIQDRASGGALSQFGQDNAQFEANQQLFRDAFGGAVDIERTKQFGGAAGTSAPKSRFMQDSQRNPFFIQIATSGENQGQPQIIPLGDAQEPVGGLFDMANPLRRVTTPEGQSFQNLLDPEVSGLGQGQQSGGGSPKVFSNRASDASVQQRSGIASLVDQVEQVTQQADRLFAEAQRGERGTAGAVAKELAPELLGDIVGGAILSQDTELATLVAGTQLLAQSAARAFESGRLSDQDIVFKFKQLGRASHTLTESGLKSFKRKLRAAKRQMIVNMKIVAAQRPELFTEPGELETVRNMPLPSIVETQAPRDNEEIMRLLEAGEALSSEELDIAEDLLNASESQ